MKKHIILFVITAFSFVGVLPGCLKDKDYDDQVWGLKKDENSKVVDMYGPVSGLVVSSLNVSARDTTFDIVIVRISPEPLKGDLTVMLRLNPQAIDDYNAAHGTHYVALPANLYQIPSMAVRIPAGSNKGYLKAKVIPDNLTGASYALGFTIDGVSDPAVQVSGNFKTQVAAIGIKNKYQGNYRSTGYFDHPTSPRAISRDKFVSTINTITSEMELGDLGQYIKVTVNPDNSLNVEPGAGTSGTSALVDEMPGDPTYNNTYDPVTKTFKLKYGYPMPAPTRIITEKVVLK